MQNDLLVSAGNITNFYTGWWEIWDNILSELGFLKPVLIIAGACLFIFIGLIPFINEKRKNGGGSIPKLIGFLLIGILVSQAEYVFGGFCAAADTVINGGVTILRNIRFIK